MLEEKIAKGDACHHCSNNEVPGNIATLNDAPGLIQQKPLGQNTKNERQKKNDAIANECCHTGDKTRQIWPEVAKHRRRQQNKPLHKKRD